MMAREVSQRTYPQVGVPERHHATSHHQDDQRRSSKLVKIQNYHVTLLAHFLEKLKTTPDGDGNLLDHSLILYGSGMSNSNMHNHFPLPNLMLGGGGGAPRRSAPEATPRSHADRESAAHAARKGRHADGKHRR